MRLIKTHPAKLLLLRTDPYSRSKYKVLSLLLAVAESNPDAFISIKRIAIYTGVPYYSLGKLLKRYSGYNYIQSRACGEFGSPYSEGYSEYRILAKGEKWIRRAETDLRHASEYNKELSERIKRAQPVIKELLQLPFKDFLNAIKNLDSD